MRVKEKILTFSLTLISCICMMSTFVFAGPTSQDGLEVTLTTDKSEYNVGEEVEATLTVKNTNNFAVNDITLENIMPKGYRLVNDSSVTKQVKTLNINESISLATIYESEDTVKNYENNLDNSEVKNDNEQKNIEDNESTKIKAPLTGDKNHIILFIVLMLIITIIAIMIIKNKKNMKRMFSLFLCLVIISSTGIIPNKVNAAENEIKKITIKETIKIGDQQLEIIATVKYDSSNIIIDTDNDIISDEFEKLLGTDPTLDDTDGDGLSDYNEIFITGSDPVETDTDGNGINDGQEDFDSDGIINIDEIKLGTDPNKADSDGDGLNDYDEVYIYNTNPIESDTDGDTILDGDEILLGLNPLTSYTDGINLDSKRLFEQELQENCIEDSLKEENDFIPIITGNVSGNINKHVEIKEANISALDNTRIVIGKQIDIKTDYEKGTDLRLSFENKNNINRFDFYMICKYTDGEISPCDTISEENNIWTTVEEGTYFVVDAEALLSTLNIPIKKYKNASYNIGKENDEIVLNQLSLVKQVGHIYGQADIVFAIDTTGSMSGAINNVVSNIDSFVDTLQSDYSVNANFALIDYKDITCGENTILIQNDSSAWFDDITSFKSKINELVVNGGEDEPETPIDALAMAQKLNFRPNANKFIILVTDANYKNDNNYNISSMDEMVNILKDSGITTSVISANSYESYYHNLYTKTNGVFGNIYGDFKSTLLKLADNIGEIVNDGSWVLLSDYQFIKLKQPLGEEGGDSDGDNILDVDELGEKKVSDVTPYINWVLKNYNIPEGMYDDPTTVNVYKYKSNPILVDTDFDGITDDKDLNPKNGNFTGKLLGYYDISNANYTMDYRDFFNSNTKYSENLCSSSLIFANTIYNDCGFSYNINENKEITDINKLMEYHGFESVADYQLANGYNKNGISMPAYKDDNVSEIGIGYHTVNYKGKTKTILGVIIRGTNGTIEEWSSNFDMGNPAEWKSDYHKGFLKTEERIEDFINRYINVFLSDKTDLVYWITGHSRGAALANILSAKLVDNGNNVFAYTFATPSTTISSSMNDSKYNCIFNFANTSDFVTYVPLKEWNFGRFGITKNLSIEDAKLEDEWCSQTGVSKYNAMNKNAITLATNRITKSCSKTWKEVYDYAGSQNINDNQYNCISNRAKKYCKFDKRNSIFGKHIGYKIYPSTAFAFQLGAEMLGGNDKEKENVKAILPEFWNSKYFGVILLFLGDAIIHHKSFNNMELNESLVGDGHAPATYYILTH